MPLSTDIVRDEEFVMETLAIIVNYHASAFIEDAVVSIINSPSIGAVRTVMVDNSADADEALKLRKINRRHPEADLIISEQNIGFGRACNVAFERYLSDMVLLLNPDARLMGDCLIRLQQELFSDGDVGGVGPLVYWDDRHEYMLPPSYPPFLYRLQPLMACFSMDSAFNRMISAIWRCFSIKVWTADRPVSVPNLSGGNVLLKKDAILKAGGLFDPQFFLYYEDTDLFVRLRKSGFRLQMVPEAKAVHYYDQCDSGNWSEKRVMMEESHYCFIRKHYNRWHQIINKMMIPLLCRQCQPAVRPYEIFNGPFKLLVPEHLRKEWLFEWSPNSNFIPAVGRFGKGPEMIFSKDCWRLLAPGTYYGRISKPDCLGKTQFLYMWIKEH